MTALNHPLVKLSDICSFKTGKLNSNAAQENGVFPFFTCAQETYRINTAAFNTEAVLLGGNNANGVYPLKYFRGEFNAYQRTYVIESLDSNKLMTRFLYYSLRPALNKFQAMSIGAATQYLTKSILDNFQISLPNVFAQKKIVDILSNYDDLIDNNKRRIALLEESARLLYREWFVHFRFPGYEHIKIIDGLPEGWTKVKYEDILGKVKKKGKIKKEQYQQDGLFPCIDQSKDFIAGYIDDVELVFSEPLPVLIFGDHTRIVKFIDFPFVQGADGTQILIPKNDEITPVFFYFLTQSIDLANAFYARHFKFLKATEIILPTQNLIKQFEKSVGVNMKQIKTLREMNRKLTQARDILLPRLMNGDLAV